VPTPRRAAATLIACLFATPSAVAHAILIDSTPAPLAHIPAGHLDLVFHYNSRIDAGRSKITLRRPDRSETRLTLTSVPTEDALKASLDLVPGAYTASWQVLATDGHITRGNVPFTVDATPAAH
jgi:methionine-rich copper-binding protein CopC